MARQRRTTRSRRANPRLASARARRTAAAESKLSTPVTPYVPARQRLFNFYCNTSVLAIGAVIVGYLTLFAHDVLIPATISSGIEMTVGALKAVWRSPTLIFAGAFVISVLWCIPWDQVLGTSGASRRNHGGDSNFRRGRELNSHDRALRLSRARRRRHQSRRR